MNLTELMSRLNEVASLVPGDIEVIAEEDHPRGEGLAFDIRAVEVDGVVRVRLI